MSRREVVDRESVCPFLIRVFIRKNSSFRQSDFSVKGDCPTDCEVNIHTWKDATLKELCSLIRQVNEDARKRSSTLEFSSCYFDQSGRMIFRHLGSVCAARPGRDDRKTLEVCGFHPGNHICVVIRERENEQKYSSNV